MRPRSLGISDRAEVVPMRGVHSGEPRGTAAGRPTKSAQASRPSAGSFLDAPRPRYSGGSKRAARRAICRGCPEQQVSPSLGVTRRGNRSELLCEHLSAASLRSLLPRCASAAPCGAAAKSSASSTLSKSGRSFVRIVDRHRHTREIEREAIFNPAVRFQGSVRCSRRLMHRLSAGRCWSCAQPGAERDAGFVSR
jgi:hypothetical protein